MSKLNSIFFGPENIQIGVLRSRRIRRISMRFTPPDKFSISCPLGVKDSTLEDFLLRNSKWLAEKKKFIEANIEVKVGAKIPFKGKFFIIKQDNSISDYCKIHQDQILIPKGSRNIGFVVRDFLIAEISAVALPLVAGFSEMLGEKYKGIKFKDTKSRWGSCTSDKSIMLSWRLIMAPEEILEYVVAHEVAHLKHMNHSPKFWETVELLCNDHKRLRGWVKYSGANLFKYKFGSLV